MGMYRQKLTRSLKIDFSNTPTTGLAWYVCPVRSTAAWTWTVVHRPSSLSVSLFLSLSLSLSISLSINISLTHIHTHARSLSRSLSLPLSPSLSLTHTKTFSLSRSLSHTHSLSLALPLGTWTREKGRTSARTALIPPTCQVPSQVSTHKTVKARFWLCLEPIFNGSSFCFEPF